jgi:predicted enzyme related to lactoylglutathione lyase
MRPGWLEIPTKDVESSKKFYSKVLGWKYEDQNGMTFIRD